MAGKDSDQVRTMRSPLGRVRGLGAARSGVAHWWAQRLTALALVPLSLWFIGSIIALAGADQAAAAHWAGHTVNAVLLLCLVLATFYHMQLGLQVVIEDYIHTEPSRLAALLATKSVVMLLALAALISVLRLAL